MVSTVQRKEFFAKERQTSGTQMALEDQVRSELITSAYACVRAVACRVRDGVLTLHGQVPTYFHKQIAQTVVLQRLNRSVPIDNQLRVVARAGR
jgi:hypothetical protein